jgi:hypothetical protein
LGSLKTEDSKQKGGRATTDPTEATRRHVRVAREGCREESVTKDQGSIKKTRC